MIVLALLAGLLGCIGAFLHFAITGEWYEASKAVLPSFGFYIALRACSAGVSKSAN